MKNLLLKTWQLIKLPFLFIWALLEFGWFLFTFDEDDN